MVSVGFPSGLCRIWRMLFPTAEIKAVDVPTKSSEVLVDGWNIGVPEDRISGMSPASLAVLQ